MSDARLTPAQARLLDEIKATKRGVLYIQRYGRYERTVLALARKGLIRKVEFDHSSLGMDGWAAAEGPDHG